VFFEEGGGVGQVVGLDHQDGAAVGHKAGGVLQVDGAFGQFVANGMQGAGIVFDLDGQHFQRVDGDAFVFEARHGGVILVDQDLHHAQTAGAGDGDPADVDAAVAEGFGDAGGEAGLVFRKYGDEFDGAHNSSWFGLELAVIDDTFGFAFADRQRAGGDQLDFGLG